MRSTSIAIAKCFISFAVSFALLAGLDSFVVPAEAQETATEDALSIQAWECYFGKKYDKAIELFQKAAKLYPDGCDPYDGLGWSYLAKGDIEKADEYFKKSLGINAYYASSLRGIAQVNLLKYPGFNRAWSYYYAGKFDKAIKEFNMVLSGKSERLPEEQLWRTHSGLAWSYYWKKDYDMAIRHFNDVLKVYKNNFDSLKGTGLAYFEKGDMDNAIKNLKASLEVVEYQPLVQSTIGWAYHKKKDFKKAVQEFEKAKKLNPYLAEPYKGLGWAYLALKDYKKAKEALTIGIQIYPAYVADNKFRDILRAKKDWSDLYKTLGWSYYYYGGYKQALIEFESALREAGEDAELLRGLGYASYKVGEYDKAIEYLKKSFAADPNLIPVGEYVKVPGTFAIYWIKSDAQSTMAWALYYKEKYEEAIKEFREVVKKHPDWIDVHDGLGWAYFMTKDYDKSGTAFKKAITIDPGYADALNGLRAINAAKYGKAGLGWNYYYQGAYKLALKQFEDVLKGKGADLPKDQLWAMHGGMGWCHYWLGDLDKAEREFRLVLKEKKDNADALVGLGYVLSYKKDYEGALKNLQTVLKTVPRHYEALKTSGWCYYQTKDYARAVDAFKKAVAINIYLVDPYLGLGLSYYRNRNYKEAKETLGTAIDIYPDYVLTDEFNKILEEQRDWVDLYTRFGWSYYYKGLTGKASKMFVTALEKDASSKSAQLGIGSVYFQRGDYKAAIRKMEPLLADKPKKEKGWYKWSYVLSHLAWSYYYTGKYDKALGYFKQVLALHADDDIYADPYSGTGWCLLKKGDTKGAKREFQRAIKLYPGYINAVNGLAELEKMQ